MLSKAWYIGNTTLRNPRRLKQGLEVYANSSLHGHLIGRQQEHQFAKLLHENGVVNLLRLDESSESDCSDLGRKWRAALMQLGFITHKDDSNPYTITPNGSRLINTTTLPQENEIFLRSLLVYQIPSPIEDFPSDYTFSPLRVVLETLKKLDENGMDSSIHFDEMSVIVQRAGLEDIEEAVGLIKEYRLTYAISSNKKHFARDYRDEVSKDCIGQAATTLRDYADTNFRYLRLTGLFNENAHRLSIAPYKKIQVAQILENAYKPIEPAKYLDALWYGASLPTDNSIQAKQDIKMLIQALHENGIVKEYSDVNNIKAEDLSQFRLYLEDELFKAFERQFASKQKDQTQDIINYLKCLTNPKAKNLLIPSGEAPAYFEWTVWRAFLAINSLKNEPWDARRFRIDENFKPINTAPGGGSDIIFEFDDFVIIVEVTLTTSSRQEASEGEPVRRHIAQYVDQYEQHGKKVYGLFIANNINTNTAETFRIGCWFRVDDTKMLVRIVPLTILQFANIFEKLFVDATNINPNKIVEIIRNCLVESNQEAPTWKRRINEEVERFCK